MTPTETSQVLAYFAATWPNFDPSELTVGVWSDQLRDLDAITAHKAARRLAGKLEWAPSLARLREECRLVQREQTPAITAGRASELDRKTAARVMGALAAGMAVAARNIPKHNHHRGWENCEACNYTGSDAQEVMAAIRSELDDQGSAA